MNLSDIILKYLTDNDRGIQKLITWFLNDVMKIEVAQQSGVPRYAKPGLRRTQKDWDFS